MFSIVHADIRKGLTLHKVTNIQLSYLYICIYLYIIYISMLFIFYLNVLASDDGRLWAMDDYVAGATRGLRLL